ncbi:unnamed protein product [Clonostachys byssicola]|uniref:MATE efflux family protein n=1 Tax=Clonostachys byssicola TaxID=160290 RepID=A0A9N9XZP3_9HYPO|nr:unnamed protein product [Clonostachys byssicola]
MSRHNETSPLLSHQREDGYQTQGRASHTIYREALDLFKATVPISASFALQNIVQAASVIIVGRLGPHELGIASYGYMFATCTGSMVAIGGATALDTLCGQAISSPSFKAQPTILGKHLQQSLFILSLLFLIFITPIWIFSNRLFLILGQESWLAEGTGKFLLWMLPAGYSQMIVECLKKYAQVQGQSNAVGWAALAATVIGVGANFVFVHATALRIHGAPVAFFIYQFATIAFLSFLLLKQERGLKTIRLVRQWSQFSHGLLTNASLAITGLLTIATEWWSFEILAIMAANLSTNEISAQSILMSADLIFTTVSLGIGVAVSHQVGKALGAKEIQLARRAAMSSYLLAACLGILELALIMSFRNSFGYLFTSDPEVVETTAKVLPFMAVFQILDLTNGGAGGILRGVRMNHLSGMCNFMAYYGVGLTTAWALCFRLGWRLTGLWAGIITGSGALLVLQTGCVSSLSWTKLVNKASGEISD